MSSPFNIVIAGAGMVGLALASRLAAHAADERLRVLLLDAGSPPAFDVRNDVGLRVSALSAGSIGFLESLSAWQEIRQTRACPYRDMRVWDFGAHPDGPDALHFDAAEHALPELGFIVENELVRRALFAPLANSNVVVEFDARIQSIDRRASQYRVRLQDGSDHAADLLVAADGANSFVRRQVGLPVKGWNYAQKALVTHVMPQCEHRSTAWQRFLRSGPIGLLPLADGRVSVVWSTRPDTAEEATECDDAALAAMLTEASDGALGQLEIAAPRATFPLRAQYAKRYVAEGVALIGDAAHSIHPLAGQGANLGLADAATLASVITAALSAGEHPADLPVLRRYERARKGANQTMLRFVDGLNRLFTAEAAPLDDLRSAGLRLFNRSGPIKRRAVEVALGMDEKWGQAHQ